MSNKVKKTDAEWRSQLNDQEYHVLRKSGTERAFTGTYYKHDEVGTYICNGCDAPLFDSTHKYHSGCGWPSFWSELETAAITRVMDYNHNMIRVELRCSSCDSHLGHIFKDGPEPSGERYCINSVCLKFVPKT
jgi:peptide-methionine (R)-S-oxide reductase